MRNVGQCIAGFEMDRQVSQAVYGGTWPILSFFGLYIEGTIQDSITSTEQNCPCIYFSSTPIFPLLPILPLLLQPAATPYLPSAISSMPSCLQSLCTPPFLFPFSCLPHQEGNNVSPSFLLAKCSCYNSDFNDSEGYLDNFALNSLSSNSENNNHNINNNNIEMNQ